MSEKIIKCLKNSIGEKGNYCYSLPVETTKAVIKELNRLNNIIDELENYLNSKIITIIDPKIIRDERVDVLYEVLDKLKELKENK